MKSSIIGAVVLGIALAGCGSTTSGSGDSETQIQTAYTGCGTEVSAMTDYNGSIEMGDDGSSLIVDGVQGDKGFEALSCVINALGISDALRSRVNSTTALQGQQSATEDGLTYEWSYHPDNGVEMTVSEDN